MVLLDLLSITLTVTLIICINFISSSSVGVSISEEEEDLEICASFNVSDGMSFNLFNGQNFSQGLDDIFSTDDKHEIISSVEITGGCVVNICVINFLNQSNPLRKRECHILKESQVLNYEEYFYIVTLRCSCQQPLETCTTQKCTDIQLKESECSRLFTEKNCNECYFNSTNLSDSQSLIPNNGFSTDSFIVRDKCTLSIGKNGSSGPDYTYQGIHSDIQLNYVLRPLPSIFTCYCSGENETDGSGEHLSRGPPKAVLISLAGGVPFIFIVASVVYLAVWRWRQRNKEGNYKYPVNSSDLLQKFQEGNVYEDDGETVHYVSVGFAQALQLPYQHRYEVSRKDVIIGQVLEKGNFGIVNRGKLKKSDGTSVEVAIKQVKSNEDRAYITCSLDEIKILSFLGDHPHIVGIIGACTLDLKHRNPLLLLEFCEEGSIKKYLKKNKHSFLDADSSELCYQNGGYASFESMSNPPSSPPRLLPAILQLFIRWAMEISSGMEYLAKRNTVHADLATRNILLTKHLVAKISDFGLSQRLREFGTYVRIGEEFPLPIRWMALESLVEQRFTTASDIWSFSVLLWEMFTIGENPYKSKQFTFAQLVKYLSEDGRLEPPLYATKEIYSVMQACWAKDAGSRPNFTQLYEFFQNLVEI